MEPQLGLGTVISSEHRRVTLWFPASGETRIYAIETAPLARIEFKRGETVHDQDGFSLTVETVEIREGLNVYLGTGSNGRQREIHESRLDPAVKLDRAVDRLFSGRIDRADSMSLRYRTLMQLDRLQHSGLRGLTGCRTSLLEHQLYVAHEVSDRHAPRVLLADEVGLGKTIEAGMIIHRQLLLERIRRILIITPESLLHQWLVELIRRFNLRFSLFDRQRCEDAGRENIVENPFQSEQKILCSLEFLRNHPDWTRQACDGEWDMVVVDEAHHLQWSPGNPGPEYRIVEQLARKTEALLLLTATPEQLGKSGHFARLHLLDPDRFPDYPLFLEEENHYQPVAAAINRLLDSDPPPIETLRRSLSDPALLEMFSDTQLSDPDPETSTPARRQLIEKLLDRHGTGRMVFRNTRAAIQGFPQREPVFYPLPAPDRSNDFASGEPVPLQHLLCPEIIHRERHDAGSADWTESDPRAGWLIDCLRSLHPQKVLLITASATTVVELAEYVRQSSGIHAAVFHERMSIVERDRAAAYFANHESGTRLLICSEIGSEGRNFQFACNLILFDLPLHPDLLEQRIGRLDRIGQTRAIRIHIPYIENSPHSVLVRWYHDGLDAFSGHCAAASTVHAELRDELDGAIRGNPTDCTALIARTREAAKRHGEALHQGRDRLLELHSCRPEIAGPLVRQAKRDDQEQQLARFMEEIFDTLGVESEIHSEGCLVLHPGNRLNAALPELPEDGATVTFNREVALANEDLQFLSWDHPMVVAAMERLITGEHGNTALCAARIDGQLPGQLVVECVFVLESMAPLELPVREYLPPSVMRIVVDHSGKRLTPEPDIETIDSALVAVESDTARQILQASGSQIRELITASESHAAALAESILRNSAAAASAAINQEIERLRALARVNPAVREDEIDHLRDCLDGVIRAIDNTRPGLDAVRVIVTLPTG